MKNTKVVITIAVIIAEIITITITITITPIQKKQILYYYNNLNTIKMSNKVIKEEEIDNKDFNEHLLEAQQADLHDLERSGCVKLGKDNNNENIIIFIPRLGFKTNNEKSELMLKLMLLLFVRSVNEIVNDNYSIVYGHTNMDILNHYPLIYKFYAILPRKYKKNLQKMYIIHTNYTIRMFFEFARVFLSNKFYSKLVLLDNILDFQKIIPPTILLLPMRFLKREDDEKNIKYYGNFASLIDSFDPSIGTTRVMFVCITFIKHNNGLKREGIFRIPGDDVALSLARTRLQYAYNYSLLSNSNSNNNSASMERIDITKKKNAILIGDVELISNKPSRVQSMIIPKKEHRKSFSYNQQQKLSAKDTSAILSEDTPTSIVLISDIDTVAQILKVSIRDLPEPLIPFDTYEEMMQLTRSCEVIFY